MISDRTSPRAIRQNAHWLIRRALGRALRWVLRARRCRLSTVSCPLFDNLREIASKLREIARECRFPGARREILDLASRLERRADDLDGKSGSAGSGRAIN